MMYHNHFWGMHYGWWIFWIIVIVAAVYWLRQQNAGPQSRETPEEILKKRLARGEITVEEYEELRKRL